MGLQRRAWERCNEDTREQGAVVTGVKRHHEIDHGWFIFVYVVFSLCLSLKTPDTLSPRLPIDIYSRSPPPPFFLGGRVVIRRGYGLDIEYQI